MDDHPPVSLVSALTGLPKSDFSVLQKWEVWWRDHQEWLKGRGYMLRPRYRVGWVPTWKGEAGIFAHSYEDSAYAMVSVVPCITDLS